MNKQIFEYHPVIGYRFIPGIQTRVQHEDGGYLVRANSLGFRSEIEFDQNKKENVKRILLFGDSYTAADGVSNKKRFSDLLIQLIPGIEVFNFGMPGTGTDQQYLIYREYARDIEHDLVMVVVLVENIRRVTAKYRVYLSDNSEKILFQKPYFELEHSELILKNVPVNPEYTNFADVPDSEKDKIDTGGKFPGIRHFINKTGFKDVVQKITRYQPLPEYKSNGIPWLLMKSILLKWFSELEMPLLLIPLPLHHYVEDQSDYRDVQKRFEELNQIPNLILFDPINHLKEYPIEDRRKFRFEHDDHPSPFGHETYAKIFKPKIEELLHAR
jgi:hypothetical protein